LKSESKTYKPRNMSIPKLINQTRSLLFGYFRWKKILNKIKLKNNQIGLICAYGIGDTYNLCAHLKYFLDENNIKSVVIVVKPTHKEIPKLFPNIKKKIIVADMPGNAFLFLLKKFSKNYSTLAINKVAIAHPYFINNNDLQSMGINSNIYDVYKNMLSLSNDVPIIEPFIPNIAIKTSEKLFYQHKLKHHKTVLIAPEANSIKIINNKIWHKLVDALISLGYSVVINGINFKHEGAINLSIPLTSTVPFLDLAGHFVSIRSGLCDLISSSRCNKIVLYPDDSSSSGTLLSCYTLKCINPNNKLNELIVKDSMSYTKIIKNIISCIVN